MALLNEGQKEASGPSLPRRFKYHVVFSYASPDKEYVGAVSAAMPQDIKHFNYALEESRAEMWGRDLEKHLVYLYRNVAMYCVVFLSEAYLKSKYTQDEWKIVNQVAKRKKGYILPARLDDAPVPKLEKVVWLDRLPPEKLAKAIEDTIRRGQPKPWWFFLSMEVKVAIAALVLALVLFAKPLIDLPRPSNTSIALAAATEQAVTAHISNKGPKPSRLVAYRLTFGTLPIHDAELRLAKSDAATIPARGEVNVDLTVLELVAKCDADGNRPSRDEVLSILGSQPVTLEVDVAESDDAPGKPTKRSANFPAARLEPFVRKWVPNRVPPC